jgi:hypothetical protein
MRFRLRTLLILTTWAGLIFLGFRSPTPGMSGVISVVTLVTILFAVLVLSFGRGTSRAMAIGYLIFCGGYLVHLTLLANWLSRAMADGQTSLWFLFYGLGDTVHRGDYSRGDFIAIGHNAVACLLGIAGAASAQMLYTSKPREGSKA